MKLLSIMAAIVMRFFSPAEAVPEDYELPAPETGAAVIQEVVATPAPSPEPTATPVSEIDLVGEWEGYWEMFSASGDWNEMDTLRWDCWAEIDQEDELYLWDVDLDKDIGLASLMLERDETEIRISEGWFMNSSSGFDQWRVKLQEDDEGLLLTLRGSYVSGVGDYSFSIYLRPINE